MGVEWMESVDGAGHGYMLVSVGSGAANIHLIELE